ncbi:MAG: ABC transporter ATP-binding protein [Patescibacteria group bacterium]|jgi:ABC-2 type transport system ATP-binding protein
MAVLKIENLSKYFGQTKAVDDVSLEVEKGEIFGFLGPNGAGKTTTIRCIMDFLRPTKGEIKVFGFDSTKNSSEIKQKVGYLPADVSLYDGWTGQDHFNFSEHLNDQSKVLSQLISDFNFDPKIKFRHLSTGNKRKLGIILALMHQPELVIMDEPTAGLDPLLQNVVYKILEDFQKKGSVIFMSSHNLSEVDRICHRVAIIKEGKLVTTESIQALKAKRIHSATVHFAGAFNKTDFQNIGEIQEDLPDGFILDIKGEIDPLIKKLNRYKIADLEITHATLEEVFFEYYQDGGK